MGAPIATAALQAAIPAIIGALTQSFKQPGQLPGAQQDLIDQLLLGLTAGQGPFANLFGGGAEAFQTSIADPLLQQFQQQTAPAIQQKFIAEGQQRGTPLESALTRAGTDVQSQIDKLFLPFQQQQQQNVLSAIGSILGLKFPGADLSPTGGFFAGLQGSGAIPDLVASLLNPGTQQQQGTDFSGAGLFRTGQESLPQAGLFRKGFKQNVI